MRTILPIEDNDIRVDLNEILLAILHGTLRQRQIRLANDLLRELDGEYYTFLPIIAGGNPDNLEALNKLALEELVYFIQGVDDGHTDDT